MAKWIEALKKLTRETPTGEDVSAAVQELLNEQNDRGAALVAAAIPEKSLANLIRSYLVPLSKPDYEALFERDAPLSSFSRKIRVGYAFGLFNIEIRRDLDRIREIRNTFAHSMVPIRFSTPAVKTACAGFAAPVAPFAPAAMRHDTPKFRYLTACMKLSAILNAAAGIKRERMTVAVTYKDWPKSFPSRSP